MERIPRHRFTSSIEHAYRLIPQALHIRMQPQFLCGVDPIFVGLHQFEAASYGRSYRNTAHCAYPEHQLTLPKSRRHTTIVLPEEVTPAVIVHELGHVLHENLNFEPKATRLNWYAETDAYEAFAEAFTAWVIPGYMPKQDPATNKLLEHLAV